MTSQGHASTSYPLPFLSPLPPPQGRRPDGPGNWPDAGAWRGGSHTLRGLIRGRGRGGVGVGEEREEKGRDGHFEIQPK